MDRPQSTAALRVAVLVGGPRDGDPDVRVPAAHPPGRLPGCCIRPDPQTRDGQVRCVGCGAAGEPAIDRYQRTVDHPGIGLVYRHEPALPHRRATPS